MDDLAYLAFWIYNSTLLLHLLKSDPGLELACHELNLFVMIEVRSASWRHWQNLIVGLTSPEIFFLVRLCRSSSTRSTSL